MGILKLGGNAFKAIGKQGLLVPDSEGYYETYFGGLNVFNSRKEFYSAARCMDLFNEASSLVRRIKKGALYAENGHPKKLPGMTDKDYIARVLQIYETEACANIRDITLDLDFGKNNPQVNSPTAIGIKGSFAPAGPYASVIEHALKNNAQNLAFSKRTLVDPEIINGVMHKHINVCVTFDYVLEGGINFADKMFAPSLENFQEGQLETFGEQLVDRDMLRELISDANTTLGLEAAELGFKDEIERAISRTTEIIRKDRKIFTF